MLKMYLFFSDWRKLIPHDWQSICNFRHTIKVEKFWKARLIFTISLNRETCSPKYYISQFWYLTVSHLSFLLICWSRPYFTWSSFEYFAPFIIFINVDHQCLCMYNLSSKESDSLVRRHIWIYKKQKNTQIKRFVMMRF